MPGPSQHCGRSHGGRSFLSRQSAEEARRSAKCPKVKGTQKRKGLGCCWRSPLGGRRECRGLPGPAGGCSRRGRFVRPCRRFRLHRPGPAGRSGRPDRGPLPVLPRRWGRQARRVRSGLENPVCHPARPCHPRPASRMRLESRASRKGQHCPACLAGRAPLWRRCRVRRGARSRGCRPDRAPAALKRPVPPGRCGAMRTGPASSPRSSPTPAGAAWPRTARRRRFVACACGTLPGSPSRQFDPLLARYTCKSRSKRGTTSAVRMSRLSPARRLSISRCSC